MSVFKKFLTEKRRRDYGRKGGQGGTRSTSSTPFERRESSANVQDPANTRNKRLGTNKPRVLQSPQGVTFTNMPEPTGSVTTDQVVDTFDQKSKKGSPRGTGGGFGQSKSDAARYAGKPDVSQQAKVADDLRTKSNNPTVRRAASNVLGGGRKTPPGEELVGGQTAKSGRGQRYRQTRPSEVRGSGKTDPRLRRAADAIIKDLRADAKIDAERASAQSRGTASRLRTRMSTGYDKNLKATGDAVLKQVQGTKGVSQADASVRQSKYRASVATPPKPTTPKASTNVSAAKPAQGFSAFTQQNMRAVPQQQQQPNLRQSPGTTTPRRSNTGPKVTTTKTDAPFTGRRSPDTSRFQRIRQMRGATLDMAPPKKVEASVGNTRVTGAYSGPQPKAPPTVKADPVPKARSFSARDVQRRASRMNAARFRGRIAPGPVGIGFGAYDAWDELNRRSQAYKAAGGSGQTTTKDKWRAGVKGVASVLGYSVGAAPGAAMIGGSKGLAAAPGWALMQAGGAVGADLASKGAERAFDATYDTVAGASDWQKKQMAAANRRVQGAGTSTQSASFKSGDRAIVRDSSGRERIGYRTVKTGPDGTQTTTYKHGSDPKALRYTSSNPLERIGRGIGDSNVPWLSGALKKYYSNKDETNRQRRVSNFKRAVAAGVTPK
tara:strand:- start:3851 stop:5836 length:1986 start_codon:yes stop_codon:yes gene_type:complete